MNQFIKILHVSLLLPAFLFFASTVLAEDEANSALDAFEKICLPLVEGKDRAAKTKFQAFPLELQDRIAQAIGAPGKPDHETMRNLGLARYFLHTLDNHDDVCIVAGFPDTFSEIQSAVMNWLTNEGREFSGSAKPFDLDENRRAGIFLAKRTNDGGVVQVTSHFFEYSGYRIATIAAIKLPEPSPAALELFNESQEN